MIAVHPRLLSDTLVLALTQPDVDVVLGPGASPEAPYDLAVVMGELPHGVSADVVIHLPEDPGAQQASITTMGGTEATSVVGLASLLETLNRFLRPN